MSDAPARNGDKGQALAEPPSARPAGGDASAVAVQATETAAKEPVKDIVLLGPPTADGAGVHVIRARDERLEAGELRALQEGRPIVGEIVTLKPRENNPRVCDVTQSYTPNPAPGDAAAKLDHKGPATVATAAYRQGWDEIFGKKAKPPGASN